jgi:hypothetical protein
MNLYIKAAFSGSLECPLYSGLTIYQSGDVYRLFIDPGSASPGPITSFVKNLEIY